MSDLKTKYGFCKVSIAPLRAEKRDASEMVSQLLFGEPIEILDTENSWLKIQSLVDGYIGFLDPKQVISLSFKEVNRWLDNYQIEQNQLSQIQTPWGNQWISCGSYTSESEVFTIGNFQFNRLNSPPTNKISIIDRTNFFLNTPYLWGGKSTFGIDCSGFTQLVFQLDNIKLPRDAYQQEEMGSEVLFEDREPGDLAFFSNAQGKVIHVGFVLDQNQLIHASGLVRKDELKSDGIYSSINGMKTHNLHSIKRYK